MFFHFVQFWNLFLNCDRTVYNKKCWIFYERLFPSETSEKRLWNGYVPSKCKLQPRIRNGFAFHLAYDKLFVNSCFKHLICRHNSICDWISHLMSIKIPFVKMYFPAHDKGGINDVIRWSVIKLIILSVIDKTRHIKSKVQFSIRVIYDMLLQDTGFV